MGQIKEQAIRGTIFSYIGIGIGFISAAVLFPHYLTTEEIGLLGILLSYAMIFAQFGSLGINSVTIRYFPYFKSKEDHNHGFLPVILMVSLFGFLLTLAAFFLLRSYLLDEAGSTSGLFEEYIHFLIPLTFIILFFNVFDNYLRALHVTVLGTSMKEVIQRFLVLLALVFFIARLIDFRFFVNLYIVSFAVPALVLLSAILVRGEFTLRIRKAFFPKKLVKQMSSFALFGIIGGFSGMVISNLDRIMLERYMGLSEVGIYLTSFYFASMVSVPSRSLIKIATPHVVEALKQNDHDKLWSIYHKTSLNQLIIGLFILILIWVNIENIFHFLPAQYISGKYVILFAGLAFLMDMLSGSANDIISNSSYYRVSAYLLIFLVVLITLACIVLIPPFGMIGAALAVLVSKIINNLAKYLFVKRKFHLDPYNFSFITVAGIGLFSFILAWLVPAWDNIYIDGIVRTALITLLYFFLIYISRLSPDLNESIKSILMKVHEILMRKGRKR